MQHHIILFRASLIKYQIYVLMLKFSIKHKKSSLMLYYFVYQIWYMIYFAQNLTHNNLASAYKCSIDFFHFFIYKIVICNFESI